MKLFVIRHGQTDLNKEHILQGNTIDESLNDAGIAEINILLKKLPKDFEVIYASPHKRVKESVEIILSKLDKSVIVLSELNERDFGSLAGKKWKEIPDGLELRSKDRKLEYDYKPFGGESVEDVARRVKKFLRIAKESGYTSALVVTSRGVLQLLYKILQDEVVIDIPNASIHEFEI